MSIRRSDVTVIVPTKNEEANVGRFLASLPDDIRLVVVDSSDDRTPAIVLEGRPDNTVLIRDPGGIAASRQLGSEHATTRWLAFTDADVEFEADFFERLERLSLTPEVAGIVGTKRGRDRYSVYYHLFSEAQALVTNLGLPAASGSNMLVRADALRLIGGFDTDLTVNEDSEMMYRLSKAGYRVVADPDLAVYAFDHRRLEKGWARKTLHGWVRCVLLFSGLMPRRLARADWGYWT